MSILNLKCYCCGCCFYRFAHVLLLFMNEKKNSDSPLVFLIPTKNTDEYRAPNNKNLRFEVILNVY